jgi:cytochrome P450
MAGPGAILPGGNRMWRVSPLAAVESLPALPFDRSTLLEVAPLFRELQDTNPVSRVRTPAGDPAWLVLGHENIRTLLANPNLGRSHPDPDNAPRFSNSAILGRPTSADPEKDRADHARVRMVLNRSFSLRRMEALRPRVQATVEELLDGLAARTAPADLHEALSFPLPALVICELLGVPYEDREDFRRWSDGAADMSDRDRASEALQRLYEYMRGLIAAKRERPGEDAVSDLVHARDVEGRLGEGEMVELAAGLLFAGHETTVTRIDTGTLLLLVHEDQRALLQADPALAPSAVEEIMRVSATNIGALPRYALTDVEIAGVTIRAGEMVLVGLDAANRDDRVFAEPDRFDIRRERNPHVAFGHGYRFCLGAPLARIELQSVFGALFRRFPTLRLAVPVEEIRMKSHLLTGGLEALPVTW